jgi:hypothetical protein
MEVCHNDGSRDNNELTNLRYGTRKENAEDRERHGTNKVLSRRGKYSGETKLSEDAVLFIRQNPQMTLKALGKKFGVHLGTIHCVRTGKTWGRIPTESRK